MATGKKSFILYCDLIHMVEQLTDQEAGILFKHILKYVNDLNPLCENRMVNLAFEPIKQQLKRDLKDWETVIEKRSLAGKASVESKKQKQHMLTHVKSVQHTSTHSTVNVNDNVTVNDNVKEIRKVFAKPPLYEVVDYFVTKTEHNWNKAFAMQEAQKYFNFYESNGWKVGKNSMKDWNAAANNWIARNNKDNETKGQRPILS